MEIKPKTAWFLAFTGVFSVLAGFVFWGTWQTTACPVMPDARMYFPEGSAALRFLRTWMATGEFAPFDLRHFAGSPYLWQELQYAVAVFCAGLALAYYLRGRALHPLACYGAGLFLSFCGYWFTLFSAGHLGWFEWMVSGVFAFGLADRAVRKGKTKNWVLLAATVAWGAFYQPDLWLLFTVFTGAYLIWCCCRERRLPSLKNVAAAGVVFALIVAPAIVSAVKDKAGRDAQIEASRKTALTGGEGVSDREGRWIFVTNWSLPPAETAEFFIPRLNGDTSCQMVLGLGRQQRTGVRPYTGALGRAYRAPSGNYRQHSLYVGFLTCLLALAAVVFLFAGRRAGRSPVAAGNRREILFFAGAAVLFYLLSLGRNVEPLYRLVFAIPVGDSIRAPVKWHHLTELCLCVLAGFGLVALLRFGVKESVFRRGRLLWLGGLVLFGAAHLAYMARFYCAAVDLSVVRAPNPAAEAIVQRGGGKVADLLEGGQGLVAWSFAARGLRLTPNPAEEDVRFVWASVQMLNSAKLRAWLKERRAVPVGAYTVTPKAIRVSDGRTANVMLMALPDVPGRPKTAPDRPPWTFVTSLGVLSLLATAGAAFYGVKKS